MKKKDESPEGAEDGFEIVDSDGAPSIDLETPTANATASSEKISELQNQVTKLSNDYLYLRAEFDNYRKQAIKERADILKYGGERLAKDLLDTLDIFETALGTEISPENIQTFVTGIQMTAQQLRNTLQKNGIQELPAEGLPFDPVVHEALSSEPTDAMPPGHVARVFKKAYKYHDKTIRPAQVIVAKAKES